jgi:hypothetical protein
VPIVLQALLIERCATMEALPFGLGSVRPHHLTHISLYDFWRGPSLTVKKPLVSLSRVGAK